MAVFLRDCETVDLLRLGSFFLNLSLKYCSTRTVFFFLLFPPQPCLLWAVIGAGGFAFTMHYTCVQVRQMRGSETWREKRVEEKREIGGRK